MYNALTEMYIAFSNSNVHKTKTPDSSSWEEVK